MGVRLFARSPRVLTVGGNPNDTTRCDLYIWNDPASIPATPTKVLSKPIPSNLLTTVNYNISPYILEFITHNTFSTITSMQDVPVNEYCNCQAKVYVNDILAQTYDFTCFAGYGYHEDGNNPSLTLNLLKPGNYQVSETTAGSLYFFNENATIYTARYYDLQTGGLTSVPITGNVKRLPYVLPANFALGGNRLDLFSSGGGGVVFASYTFETICEPKYQVLNCDFVNKYGVWQRIHFFKASRTNLEMSNTEYNLMPSNVFFTSTTATRKAFNVNGQESLRVNTGWVKEEYDDVIRQLMFSTRILIDNKPVVLKTKGVELFKHINEKLINYEIEFNYAYNKINNII